MDDPILKLRLEMLDENLRTALRMTQYLVKDLNYLHIDSSLRELLIQHFDGNAMGQQKRLGEELTKFDNNPADRAELESAWSRYAELRERNAQIYREFLEAMLGLAIRRNDIDDGFCRIADALIISMSSFIVRADALAIPASQEAYSRTLARLVRMRFPESTIWSLPLVVHEFGHVVIEDLKLLEEFAKNEASAIAAKAREYVQKPNDKHERKRNQTIERRAFSRVRQLIADAYAVYTIGPSYACSLILLRLSPVSSDSADGCPRDAERATVAIEVLRKMDSVPPSPRLYSDIIRRLEQEWAGMMDRSGVEPLEKESRDELVDLAGRINAVLNQALVIPGYETTLAGGGGWNTAYAWYDLWTQHANPNQLPTPENITHNSKIYDALNAAWAYRIFFNPQDLEPVAKATKDTCEAIIKEKLLYLKDRRNYGGGKSRRGG